MKGPLERGIFSFTGHIIKSKFYRSSYMFWDTSLFSHLGQSVLARSGPCQSSTISIQDRKFRRRKKCPWPPSKEPSALETSPCFSCILEKEI